MSEVLERLSIYVNDLSGVLTFRYRWKGFAVAGVDTHDEDVSDWSDRDIRNVVVSYLGEEARSLAEETPIEHV